jgi:hypothetical protein
MPSKKQKQGTCSKSSQVVATHAGAAVGLPPPGSALTQLPEALRPVSGALRLRPDSSPYAARSERRGESVKEVVLLLAARASVRRGDDLLSVVATGDVDGWRLREALTNACGRPLANWDGERCRTQADRVALVERTLGLYGYVAPRRGGWSVSQ